MMMLIVKRMMIVMRIMGMMRRTIPMAIIMDMVLATMMLMMVKTITTFIMMS